MLLPHLDALPPATPILIDFHGAVPEEQALLGNAERARQLEGVESAIARRASTWLCVTRAMERYYRGKHPEADADAIHLPLQPRRNFGVPVAPDELARRKASRPRSVVYAGGTQAWQNVDRICEACRSLPAGWEITVLTPDREAFLRKLAGAAGAARILTVPPSEVGRYYAEAAFGFILRDDNPVNQVALPGKLLEYLTAGVVPVVLQPRIGDFQELGYSYLLHADLVAGRVPDGARIEDMVRNNLGVVQRIAEEAREGAAVIRRRHGGSLSPGGAAPLPRGASGPLFTARLLGGKLARGLFGIGR
jgi:hypothetical protein